MTLYRIDLEAAGTHDTPFAKGLPGALPFLIEDGVLVEVEPCLHGNYDTHHPSTPCHCEQNDAGVKGVLVTSFDSPDRLRWQVCTHEPWCPGAGIGDTE